MDALFSVFQDEFYRLWQQQNTTFQNINSYIYFIQYPICSKECLKPFCKVQIGMIQANISLINLLKIQNKGDGLFWSYDYKI